MSHEAISFYSGNMKTTYICGKVVTSFFIVTCTVKSFLELQESSASNLSFPEMGTGMPEPE